LDAISPDVDRIVMGLLASNPPLESGPVRIAAGQCRGLTLAGHSKTFKESDGNTGLPKGSWLLHVATVVHCDNIVVARYPVTLFLSGSVYFAKQIFLPLTSRLILIWL
jgi:hypothetical protein